MVSPLSPVAAASRNLSSPWLKRKEGMYMPLDVRLSLRYRLHSQYRELEVFKRPIACESAE